MTYKTRAIIIGHRNASNADKIIIVYSEKYGKLHVLVKGAKKILSKLSGHVGLFYLTNLIIAKGKTIDRLTNAEIITVFSGLKTNLKKTQSAYQIAEMTNRLIKEKEPSEEIFRLLMAVFIYLESNENPLLLSYFGLRLLSLLGHKPEIDVCVRCRSKLKPDLNYFSYKLGGILCSNCAGNDLSADRIPPELIKILRLLINCDLAVIDKVQNINRTENMIKKISVGLIQYITERELRTFCL